MSPTDDEKPVTDTQKILENNDSNLDHTVSSTVVSTITNSTTLNNRSTAHSLENNYVDDKDDKDEPDQVQDTYYHNEFDKMLPRRERTLSEVYRDMEQNEDTRCGLGLIQGEWLQMFANKKAYVFIYGFLGCLFSATYAYFNGILTMIEKRFKIPSRTTGIISVGNDISALFVSAALSYYAGRGNRPRWIAFGLFLIGTFCLLSALPQLLYGSGESALMLTVEYGSVTDRNATAAVIERETRKKLCHDKEDSVDECEIQTGNFPAQVILFIAQLIAGVGGSLYHTLGVSYMDDNIQKAKTPALISLSYFIRLLGPAIGYGLASICLQMYISPSLTPTIDQKDPRWLGAWWIGWFILAIPLYLFSFLMAMFPKTLPRAAARKLYAQESIPIDEKIPYDKLIGEEKASWTDMMVTFRRLMRNKTFMLNNMANVFYFMGFMPYWIFLPKYIETQYRQTAAVSSLVTGMVGLLFSALGILVSGFVISKYKPSARYLAGWNVVVGIADVVGISSYPFLGCDAVEKNVPLLSNGQLNTERSCNAHCNCDTVKYSLVCSANGLDTFISACHAGCKQQLTFANGSKIFTNCSCIEPIVSTSIHAAKWISTNLTDALVTPATTANIGGGIAYPGACPVDCQSAFYAFLFIVCMVKFMGSSGRTSNFLVSVRCVEEKDKPAAMGFGLMIMSLLAFIPSPILFGIILDKTCLVWGKTCTGTGNCWLYNVKSLRYIMNFTAATFVAIGTLIDCGVWFYVKDLKIFDDAPSAPRKEAIMNEIELSKSDKNDQQLIH